MRTNIMTRIKLVNENNEKIRIMKLCDNVFPIRLYERDNCDEIIRRIINFALFYAAYVENEGEFVPIGYAAIYVNDVNNGNAYISSIGVKGDYQGQHIGSMLMETGLREARRKGMKYMRLEVLKTNDKAISFYKNWLFEIEKEGKDTFYMRRGL